jgi:Helix-turn-helix domain
MPLNPPPAVRPQSHPRRPELPAPGARAGEPPAPPMFLNNDAAARFLNLSPRTLEKHRVIGDGPRFRKLGRRIVYALADLEAWADARTCESTSDPHYIATR